MTPEQLDEIKKLARDPNSAAFHDLMARQTIPLVKALREARAETDIAKAFHDVAVKERDYERALNARLREALERIANPTAIGSAFHEEAVAIARRAL